MLRPLTVTDMPSAGSATPASAAANCSPSRTKDGERPSHLLERETVCHGPLGILTTINTADTNSLRPNYAIQEVLNNSYAV